MEKIKILEDTNVYADCSFKSPVIGKIEKDTVINYETYVNGWFKITYRTWVHTLKDSVNIIRKTEEKIRNVVHYDEKMLNLQLFAPEENDPNKKEKPQPSTGITTPIDTSRPSSGNVIRKNNSVSGIIDTLFNEGIGSASKLISDDNALSLLSFKDSSAMLGMPYQFMKTVDARIGPDIRDERAFGRKYSERIATRTPMLVMAAGLPSYMSGASAAEKESMIQSLIGGDINNFMNSNSSDPGRYYTFKLATADYFQYVNSLCYTAATFLNILHGRYIDYTGASSPMRFMGADIGQELDKTTTNFSQTFTQKAGFAGGVGFYINSDSQVSESISTSPTASQIAAQVNGISDMAKEVQFLLGTTNNGLVQGVQSAANGGVAQVTQAANALLKNFDNGSSLIRGISSSLNNIMAGGKMIFPEIWQDTQFSRSYQVNIKLTSPDNDNLSIYHNIMVPLMHLIAFALPRGSSTNSYISPFLVRAAYKSFFKVDMGLITDMSITRGAEGCWNQYGIPTTVDVSFTIKELYGIMNLAKAPNAFTSAVNLINGTSSYSIMQNDMLLDYIAGMCGVNLLESDVTRAGILRMYQVRKGLTNIPHTISNALQDYASTYWANLTGQV